MINKLRKFFFGSPSTMEKLRNIEDVPRRLLRFPEGASDKYVGIYQDPSDPMFCEFSIKQCDFILDFGCRYYDIDESKWALCYVEGIVGWVDLDYIARFSATEI